MRLMEAVTAARIVKQGRVVVECVPPEEFRVCDTHDSGDLKDCRFVAHTRRRTASDLLAEGYDPEIIENAQDGYLDRESNTYSYVDPEADESQKLIVVTRPISVWTSTRTASASCARSRSSASRPRQTS